MHDFRMWVAICINTVHERTHTCKHPTPSPPHTHTLTSPHTHPSLPHTHTPPSLPTTQTNQLIVLQYSLPSRPLWSSWTGWYTNDYSHTLQVLASSLYLWFSCCLHHLARLHAPRTSLITLPLNSGCKLPVLLYLPFIAIWRIILRKKGKLKGRDISRFDILDGRKYFVSLCLIVDKNGLITKDNR